MAARTLRNRTKAVSINRLKQRAWSFIFGEYTCQKRKNDLIDDANITILQFEHINNTLERVQDEMEGYAYRRLLQYHNVATNPLKRLYKTKQLDESVP